ncbi:MAG: fumarate hydratase, partial [Acidobacteria bacterium]
MTEFTYQDPFPLGEDKTEYKFLSDKYTSLEQLGSHQFLGIRPEGLTLLARQAMRDVSFYLRSSHNAQVACILKDPAASDNDKFVARTLLKNA